MGPELIDAMRAEVVAKIAELEDQVAEINERLWVPTEGVTLPELPPIPAPKLNGVPSPLVSSDMGHVEFVRTLKRRGAYAKGGDDA